MNGKDIIKAMSIRHDWHVDVCEGRHDTNPIAKIDELCGTSFMKMLTKKREEWEKETAEYFIEAHREIADEDADTHDEDCYICNIIRNLDANEITQKEAENEIIGEALGDEESNSSMRGRKSFEFEEEVNEEIRNFLDGAIRELPEDDDAKKEWRENAMSWAECKKEEEREREEEWEDM